jgi:hypothetical protein
VKCQESKTKRILEGRGEEKGGEGREASHHRQGKLHKAISGFFFQWKPCRPEGYELIYSRSYKKEKMPAKNINSGEAIFQIRKGDK